jgi:WD40 repeat protein
MLAWGGYNYAGQQFDIYRFNGSSITGVIASPSLGTQVNAVSFSPDGRYLLACGANGAAGIYGLYRVNLSGATLVGSTQTFGNPGVATTVAWSPDSKYVLIGGTNTHSYPNWAVISLPITRQATAASTQGFSNGLLFGDKLKGSSFDANVNVLSGAVVKVKGMVKDDSF